MQTYNGSDSAGVRGQSSSESRIEVCIKEDRTYATKETMSMKI